MFILLNCSISQSFWVRCLYSLHICMWLILMLLRCMGIWSSCRECIGDSLVCLGKGASVSSSWSRPVLELNDKLQKQTTPSLSKPTEGLQPKQNECNTCDVSFKDSNRTRNTTRVSETITTWSIKRDNSLHSMKKGVWQMWNWLTELNLVWRIIHFELTVVL